MSYHLIITGIITNNGEKTYTFRKDSQKIQWKEVFNYISTKSIGAYVSDTITIFYLLHFLIVSQNSELSKTSYFLTSRLYLIGNLVFSYGGSQ